MRRKNGCWISNFTDSKIILINPTCKSWVKHHQYKRMSIFINNKRVLEKGLFCHKGIYRYITNKTWIKSFKVVCTLAGNERFLYAQSTLQQAGLTIGTIHASAMFPPCGLLLYAHSSLHSSSMPTLRCIFRKLSQCANSTRCSRLGKLHFLFGKQTSFEHNCLNSSKL